MTNIAEKTIDTTHIAERIANPIIIEGKPSLDKVAERGFKIEGLDGKELMNTFPRKVIAAIGDTKLLIEECFSVTQSSFQDRHGNITDTNGNPIKSPQSEKVGVIKATNEEDAKTIKENIRVY